MSNNNQSQVKVQQVMNWLDAVLQYGLQKIPCFAHAIPAQWTDVLIAELRQSGVPDQIIPFLLRRARQLGYDLTSTPLSNFLEMQSGWSHFRSAGTPSVPQTSMSAAVPMTSGARDRLQRGLEARYRAESDAGNLMEAARLARDIENLVNRTDITTRGGEIQHGARLAPPASHTRRLGAPSGARMPPRIGPYR